MFLKYLFLCVLISGSMAEGKYKVNRHIAENRFRKNCQNSQYAILPKLFTKNHALVQNTEFFLSFLDQLNRFCFQFWVKWTLICTCQKSFNGIFSVNLGQGQLVSGRLGLTNNLLLTDSFFSFESFLTVKSSKLNKNYTINLKLIDINKV